MCFCVVSLPSWEKRRYFIMRRNSLLNDALYVDEDYFSGSSFQFCKLVLFILCCSRQIVHCIFSGFPNFPPLSLSLSLSLLQSFKHFAYSVTCERTTKLHQKPATAGPSYFYIYAMPTAYALFRSARQRKPNNKITGTNIYKRRWFTATMCTRLQPLLLHQIQPSSVRKKVQSAFPGAAQRVGRGSQATTSGKA